MVDAQNAANAKMAKAQRMIDSQTVNVLIYNQCLYEGRWGISSLDAWRKNPIAFYKFPFSCFSENGELSEKFKESVDFVAQPIIKDCESKVNKANDAIESHNEIIKRISSYNSKGWLYRALNKFG